MRSFVFYLIGIGALFGSDLLVTTFAPPETIKDWAEVRSLIGITGILCLVGMDYVMIRSPQSSARLLRILALQIPLLAILVGLVVWSMGFLSSLWVATFVAAGSAASLALSQYFRSHRHNVKSQLIRQSWKILAFVVIGTTLLSGQRLQLDDAVATILLAVVAGAVALVFLRQPARLYPQDPEPAGDLYSIGSRFMVTSLLLALAIYAEQLLVNKLGTASDAALYFTHATYFLFPISIGNGYLAFLIGPWMRDNHDRFTVLFRSRWGVILLFAAIYAIALNLFGWQAWQFINPSIGDVDTSLQLIFLVSAFMRTLYTFPSGYNGVFGRPRQHDVLIIAQIISLGIVIGFFIALQSFGYRLTQSVALASAANWMLRCLVAFAIMSMIHKFKTSKDHA